MKIVFFGTPEFVLPVLDKLITHHTVLAVITTPDELVGRKKQLTPPPVKQYALEKNIPVFQPHTIAELRDVAKHELEKISPDMFVVAAYGKIIPLEIIDFPTYGSLNLHPSRLPDYRGPSPIQETILNGEKSSAITLIKMDEDVDHGPILSVEPFQISSKDTFLTVAQKSFAQGANLLIPTIDNLVKGTVNVIEQDHTKATFTSHIQKEDGYFSVDSPPSPTQLDRMIRAYFPWPTVWTKMMIHNEEKIVKFLPDNCIHVAGKNVISIQDFLRGYPDLLPLIRRLFPTEV